ncbi:hypothetical protein ABW19_dt0209169 [Dactylella cylindrospora]|nr:hypothetical protein ABW19_dt0209169 [Dactylella cylindrospora]
MTTPSFSAHLKDVQDVVLPLIVPPASTFTTPLLNNFAASHDPLMESDALFTAKSDLGTVHVELDATLRSLARNAASEANTESESKTEFGAKDFASDTKQLFEMAKQARLRSKLRGLAGGSQPIGGSNDETIRSHATITRASKQRKEAFDEEMEKEEKEMLDEFKRKLREAVLQT